MASERYAELFVRKGVREDKIAVTGIPNFDNLRNIPNNDFPFHDYVLAVTSPLRETFRYDDRQAFIRKCTAIAGGRKLIFKLHPLENARRAIREIHEHAPGAIVYAYGNINHMIANAKTVITQQSTCTFVAIALGKEIHTNLNIDELKRLMPIQNGGSSAEHIAHICERILHTPMELLQMTRKGTRARLKRNQADAYLILHFCLPVVNWFLSSNLNTLMYHVNIEMESAWKQFYLQLFLYLWLLSSVWTRPANAATS